MTVMNGRWETILDYLGTFFGLPQVLFKEAGGLEREDTPPHSSTLHHIPPLTLSLSVVPLYTGELVAIPYDSTGK